jgi:hypothetical protein
MPEEHRAWDNAEEILRSMGFTEWDAFASAKEEGCGSSGTASIASKLDELC